MSNNIFIKTAVNVGKNLAPVFTGAAASWGLVKVTRQTPVAAQCAAFGVGFYGGALAIEALERKLKKA